MISKLRMMWKSFLKNFNLAKKAYKGNRIDTNIVEYRNIKVLNWIAIAIKKICNLACNEATFEIESESVQADQLKRLAKDVEAHRFEISNGMLGNGNYYVFPSTDSKGRLYHSYIENDRVKIVGMDGKKVVEAYAVIDYVNVNNKIYYLQRHHKLQNDVLTVSYFVVDENGNKTQADYFGDIVNYENVFKGAENIGFGWYKSPSDSRGISQIYGVPLNFGCGEIENKISDILSKIAIEFNTTETKLFADETILKSNKDNQYQIKDNIYPVRKKAGVDGSLIDIFNPQIRTSIHFEALTNYLEIYEKSIGVNKGILTENMAIAGATATAVKRSNSDTISLINAVHNSLDNGNKMLFEADALYLNINNDLWQYHSDYIDPFADTQEQFNILKDGVSMGIVKKEKLLKWLYPDMTDEEIAKELNEINESNNKTTNNAIAKALNLE